MSNDVVSRLYFYNLYKLFFMAERKRSLQNSKFTTGQLEAFTTWLSFESGKLLDQRGKRITSFDVWMGDDINPELDAVIIVGDNLRAAAEAARYLLKHNDKYGHYPNILCVPGFSIPEWFRFETPPVVWLKRILKAMRVPEDVVDQHNLTMKTKDVAKEVADFVMATDWGRIGVFSSRGYSLPVAQQLYCLLPEIKWYFNDNVPVMPEDRIFTSEILAPKGLAIDLIVANAAKAYCDIGNKRLRLSTDATVDRPNLDVLLKVIKRGYAGGLCSRCVWEYYNLSAKEAINLVFARRGDFQAALGSDEYIADCVGRLLQQYSD